MKKQSHKKKQKQIKNARAKSKAKTTSKQSLLASARSSKSAKAKKKEKGKSTTINVSMPIQLLKQIETLRKKAKPDMNRSYFIYTVMQQALGTEGIEISPATSNQPKLKSLVKNKKKKLEPLEENPTVTPMIAPVSQEVEENPTTSPSA